jgi:hypothetical protein
MNATDYEAKLADPRWNCKRLEILDRDNRTCRSCNAKDCELHVHHCFYDFDAEPWDHPDESLVTLCEVCHTRETHATRRHKKFLMDSLSRVGLLIADHMRLSHAIRHRFCNARNAQEDLRVLCFALQSNDIWWRVKHAYQIAKEKQQPPKKLADAIAEDPFLARIIK